MPLYSYRCTDCEDVFDEYYSLKQYAAKPRPQCPSCGSTDCDRVLTSGHGGIQCDSANDVKWLKSAEDAIRPMHEKPWESRKDYRECLKRNHLEAAR